MARTSSQSCSLCSTPCYSREQAESNVVDDQLPNALAADSDSVGLGVCVCGAFSFMILFQFEILYIDFIMSEL